MYVSSNINASAFCKICCRRLCCAINSAINSAISCAISCAIISLGIAAPAQAQDNPQPCDSSKARKIWFSNKEHKDTLAVAVKGNPCSEAKVVISITNPEGKTLYSYSGDFILHMPYIIYEPELNKLVDFFVNKVVSEAAKRSTGDLPAYTNVEEFYDATNDFVVVPLEQYRSMRQLNLPILWHATGDSTWVHVVFDKQLDRGQVIMRGGVFH